MYKKLFSTSLLNALTAAVNFLSSYLIVKVLSMKVFGEFAIFSSYLAFGGLLYAIIPSNFSIFKLQEDKNYKIKLLVFFILSSILFLLFIFLMVGLNLLHIGILTSYLFGISTYFLGYFDIKFQASGKLNKYFLMLFIVALMKVIVLGVFYYTDQLNNLADLLWTMTIVQLTIIFVYIFEDRHDIKFILLHPKIYKQTILFIKNNIPIFKLYYLNTFLKRLRENIIILIFSKFTPKDVIGLFSIFVKIASFIFGLSRTLEAFFMNKNNIATYRDLFYKKVIYFAIFLQILFLIVGITYLKIFTHKYYFLEILTASLLVYPHIYFLLARSEMLSNYKNREANISEVIYIVVVLVGSLLSFYFGSISFYPILITFVCATLGLQIFMIRMQSMNKIENGYD